MAEKFEMSSKLASAVALVMEQKPADWGASEHMCMVRYLVLACSDKAKLSLAELQDAAKAADFTLNVNWAELRKELMSTGKLAEAANMKKALASGNYPELGKRAKAELV